MAEQVYKLKLKSPLHVGTWGIGREQSLTYIPSDMLFSALMVTWAQLDPDIAANILEAFLEYPSSPPMLMTSAFPYAGPVRFFPRPQTFVALPEDIPYKRVKQATWVSEMIFDDLRHSRLPASHLDPNVNFIQGGQIWLTRQEREQIGKALKLNDAPDDPSIRLSLWRQATVPRVTIDRHRNSSNLFYTGRVNFSEGCGLWLAVRGEDFQTFTLGLEFLQDEGVGGLRSTGHGAFKYELWPDAAALTEPGSDEYFISLARYAPTEQDIATTLRAMAASYTLTTISGWCKDDAAHAWRRKRLRLVSEGAYLGWPGYTPGRLVDVTPDGVGQFQNDRRVYRYGLTFPVSAGN